MGCCAEVDDTWESVADDLGVVAVASAFACVTDVVDAFKATSLL